MAADPEPAVEDSITVDVVGTLRTGIVAIGGETTGTTITAQDVTWELDFGKNVELRKTAEKLNGKHPMFEIQWVDDNRIDEVVDTSGVAGRKSEAMRCHITQFPKDVLGIVSTWFNEVPGEEFIHARAPGGTSHLGTLLDASRAGPK
jgi:hypothetical protein